MPDDGPLGVETRRTLERIVVFVIKDRCVDENCVDFQYTKHSWAGHVARVGDRRGASRVLVGRPEGKRPLERPGRRWEDNIKIVLQEV
jgi:hypothetical protein